MMMGWGHSAYLYILPNSIFLLRSQRVPVTMNGNHIPRDPYDFVCLTHVNGVTLMGLLHLKAPTSPSGECELIRWYLGRQIAARPCCQYLRATSKG